jgi:hypothetical protein
MSRVEKLIFWGAEEKCAKMCKKRISCFVTDISVLTEMDARWKNVQKTDMPDFSLDPPRKVSLKPASIAEKMPEGHRQALWLDEPVCCTNEPAIAYFHGRVIDHATFSALVETDTWVITLAPVNGKRCYFYPDPGCVASGANDPRWRPKGGQPNFTEEQAVGLCNARIVRDTSKEPWERHALALCLIDWKDGRMVEGEIWVDYQLIEKSQKVFVCSDCGRDFRSSWSRKRHIRSRTCQMVRRVCACLESFKSTKELEQHIEGCQSVLALRQTVSTDAHLQYALRKIPLLADPMTDSYFSTIFPLIAHPKHMFSLWNTKDNIAGQICESTRSTLAKHNLSFVFTAQSASEVHNTLFAFGSWHTNTQYKKPYIVCLSGMYMGSFGRAGEASGLAGNPDSPRYFCETSDQYLKLYVPQTVEEEAHMLELLKFYLSNYNVVAFVFEAFMLGHRLSNPPITWLEEVQDLCQKKGAAMVADETLLM